MNGKKRGIFALLALTMVLSLAGCGKEKNTVEVVEKRQTETIIHMFAASGHFSASNQAKYWSENFSEKTDIDAVIDYEEGWYYANEGEDGRTLLRKRISSDEPDDMYIVNAEDMIDFVKRGYILDMSNFDFVDNLSDAARQLSTIDGKVYCLPLAYTGFGLYWNLDLLDRYGLKVPGNYEELIAVWDKLLENGVTPYAGNMGYGLTVPVMCLSLSEIYQSEDRDWLLKELSNGTTPISTYARKGFEFIQLMCDKGYFNPQEAYENKPRREGEMEKFMSGEVACVCCQMGFQNYADPQNTGFQVKMTGWPLLSDGVISVVGTDQKLCINPKSKNLDIVTQFVEMAGTEEALMQCTEKGAVSSGKVNDPSKYTATEKEFDELIQSDGQIPNTDMNLKLNLWEHMRDISRLILTGEATVDEACRLLDETQKQDIAARTTEK